MFSILGSLFGKKEGGTSVTGKENVTLTFNVHGDKNNIITPDFIEKINKVVSKEPIESNNEDVLKDLKKNILNNHGTMSIVDLIHETTAIASAKNDKEMLTWLDNELYGYTKDEGVIPDYRKNVEVRLNVGVNFGSSGDMFDLRDKPFPAIWASGLVWVGRQLDSDHEHKFTFVAPMPSEMKDLLMSFKPPLLNFDFNKAPFLINKSQIETIAIHVKSKILEYVSKI